MNEVGSCAVPDGPSVTGTMCDADKSFRGQFGLGTSNTPSYWEEDSGAATAVTAELVGDDNEADGKPQESLETLGDLPLLGAPPPQSQHDILTNVDASLTLPLAPTSAALSEADKQPLTGNVSSISKVLTTI